MPFDLRLTNREGVGPDGLKRNYPVFVFNMRPRGGEFCLTSGNFRAALMSGNKAAADLQLPPVRDDTPQDDAAFAFVGDAVGVIPDVPLSVPEVVLTAHTEGDAPPFQT